jgi:hypothetical protein
MVGKIKKQSKKDIGIRFEGLKGLIGGIAKGTGNLFEFITDLERQGKSEYKEEGEIEGKTKSGQKIKGAYGFRVKIGLNPEEFRTQRKLQEKSHDL